MPVLFSKSCEYAIQSVLYLARQARNGVPVHLREISRALRIPHHFLSKILQTLAHGGVFVSHKGVTGGFLLGRAPGTITLMDVVELIDGPTHLEKCLLGFPGCGEGRNCPAHVYWEESRNIILHMLRHKTIEDMGKQMDDKLDLLDSLSALSEAKVPKAG